MINPNYTVAEIDSKLLEYLTGRLGEFQVVEPLEQLQGGWEAYLYKFRISGVKGYDSKLVLRLFPSYNHPETASWQAMLHNLLLEEGVRVPKVYLHESDKSILGGTFLLMDFVEGEVIDPGVDPEVLVLTGRTQAMLHQKDGRRISKRIIEHGHSKGSHTFDGRIEWMVNRAERVPGMKEITQWILDNRPPEPEVPKILHGDFHPLNLMIKDGKVNSILDWSGFMVGDPMYDLGWSKALFIATARHETPRDVFDQLIGMYTEAYESVALIDEAKVDYYVVYRLARALLEGLEGQEFWTRPDIVDNIKTVIEEMTGISVSL